MKSVLLTIGLVAMLTPIVAEAQQRTPPQQALKPSEIVGVYECEGKNPDGTPYNGFVEVIQVQGTFCVHWILGDGEVWGVGAVSNGVFAVSYWGGAPAVVVYKMDGNRLVGEWTMGGRDVEGRTYSEVLTKTNKKLPQPSVPQGPSTPSRPPRQVRPAGVIV